MILTGVAAERLGRGFAAGEACSALAPVATFPLSRSAVSLPEGDPTKMSKANQATAKAPTGTIASRARPPAFDRRRGPVDPNLRWELLSRNGRHEMRWQLDRWGFRPRVRHDVFEVKVGVETRLPVLFGVAKTDGSGVPPRVAARLSGFSTPTGRSCRDLPGADPCDSPQAIALLAASRIAITSVMELGRSSGRSATILR